MANKPIQREDGKVLIHTAYITIKGKRVPPPNGLKCWTFWGDPDYDKKKAANDESKDSEGIKEVEHD